MKVLSKLVNLEDQKFVLITDEASQYQNEAENNSKYYGTISYDDLDDNGKLKRGLNGFEMAIADTITGAIERRVKFIKMQKIMAETENLPVEEKAKKLWDVIS